MLGAHTDLTPQKRAETALHKSQERLTLAVESAQIGVWDWDIDRKALVWDDRMCAIYGIEPDTFDGTYKAWRRRIYPDDWPQLDVAARQALKGEKPFDIEHRVIWPNGEIRYVRVFASVTHDKDGNPARMTGINMDITDSKNAEKAILESERLQGVLEMAGAICHEINQPLMVIKGYAQLLLMKSPQGEQSCEKIMKIVDQTGKLAEITQKLMNITNYETKEYLRTKIIDIDKSSKYNKARLFA
jgi:PAS domain S-box-containing protein